MSRPESVSSRMASDGCSTSIWKISLRFFSPPEKPSFTGRLHQLRRRCAAPAGARFTSSMNSIASSSGSPRCFRTRVQRRLEEVGVVHAGDLDRVLERHEHAFAGALLGIHVEQVLAVELDRAAGDFVGGMPGQHAGERALARAVGPHDGVHLARLHREVDALQNVAPLGACARSSLISSIDIDPRNGRPEGSALTYRQTIRSAHQQPATSIQPCLPARR